MTGAADRPTTDEEFVRGVYDVVFRSSVKVTETRIARPPGPDAGPRVAQLHRWWSELSSEDRAMVRSAMTLASDAAVFGFFCVLDNVRTVVDPPTLEFQLHAVLDGHDHRIPADDTIDLHDIFVDLRSGDDDDV